MSLVLKTFFFYRGLMVKRQQWVKSGLKDRFTIRTKGCAVQKFRLCVFIIGNTCEPDKNRNDNVHEFSNFFVVVAIPYK